MLFLPKFIIPPFAALLLVATASAEPKPTKEMALKAADFFRQADPMSEEAQGAVGAVFRFVDASPNVVVRITPRAVPFMNAKQLSRLQERILLGAFVVGNARAQLIRGKGGDDSYSGDRQLIESYHRMQKNAPQLRVPEIEKLVELEAKGELRSYLTKK